MSEKVQIYLTNLIVPTSQRSTTVSAGTIPVVLASDYDALLKKYEAIIRRVEELEQALEDIRFDANAYPDLMIRDTNIERFAETVLARRGREAIGGEK